MRWISNRQTTGTKRLTQGRMELRGCGFAGLSRWAVMGIMCCSCAGIVQAQQSRTQTGAQPAATPPSTTSQPPAVSQTTPAPTNLPAATQPRPTELRFVVLLDPAHGGADTGAMLNPTTPEKELYPDACRAIASRAECTRNPNHPDAHLGCCSRQRRARNDREPFPCIGMHIAACDFDGKRRAPVYIFPARTDGG